MGNGMSDISSKSLTILEPCDQRYRGYILNSVGDYFNNTLSADMSYGNYHSANGKYYLSKCVIVRNNLIYFIDGKKTITIEHDNFLLTCVKYTDPNNTITVKPQNVVFGQPYAIQNTEFNKMFNDLEYVEFYKKLIVLLLHRNISIKNRFMCGKCIKAIANVGLACGHLAYCKECFDMIGCQNYTCCICLANMKAVQKPIIDLTVFD